MAIAQLTVDITAKMASFENEIKKVSGSAKKQADSISDSFGKIGDSLKGVVSAYAGIQGINFIASLVTDTANYAKEIKNLSSLTGVSTDTFQAIAYGAKSVGVEQDGLATILEDVNEKFGELLSTGAGPLKDFFDVIAPKVGVTADSFRRLSGPEALQLYVKSLEDAGVNQDQMTFYMKALSDESTKLLPLLRNNGEGMKEMSKKAEDAGVIMSSKALDDSKKYSDELKKLEDQASETGRSIALFLMPSLTKMLETLNGINRAKVGGSAGTKQAMEDLMSADPFLLAQGGVGFDPSKPVPKYKYNSLAGAGRGFVNPSLDSPGVIETAADIAKAQKAEEDRLKKLASDKSRFASKAQSEAERARRDAENQQKAIDDYIKSLDQQNSKFKDQTVEQKAIAEIESGRFGKVLPAQRERIINSAQILDADKKEIEFQKALGDSEERRKQLQADMIEQGKDLFDQVKTPAEQYADQIVRINKLYQAGAINLETLERLTQKYFDTYNQNAGTQTDTLKTNEGLARDLGAAFENTFMTAIRDGGSLGDLLEKLGEDIAYMILQQQFIKPMADSIGAAFAGGVAASATAGAAASSGGFLDKIGQWLGEIFISFDGGGYTGTGTRSGGVDGRGGFYAVLHPNETVLDHTRGQGIASGGQNVMISQTFNFGGSNDRNQVLGAAQLGAAMAKQQIMDDRQRGRS